MGNALLCPSNKSCQIGLPGDTRHSAAVQNVSLRLSGKTRNIILTSPISVSACASIWRPRDQCSALASFSIIVAVSAPIIKAIASPEKIAPSSVIIDRSAPINVNGVVLVIVACRGSPDADAHNGSGKWWRRANRNTPPNGIDTSRHGENVQCANPCEKNREKLRSRDEGLHGCN
jgi:hypothetical protein